MRTTATHTLHFYVTALRESLQVRPHLEGEMIRNVVDSESDHNGFTDLEIFVSVHLDNYFCK